MNDINITLGNGGLARDVTNYDAISGLALYTDLKAQSDFDTASITGITDTERIKAYTSLDEFEVATGITFNNVSTEELWYQVKEFFRMAGNTKLYVGLFYNTNLEATPVPLTYSELKDMQTYANGEIRQIGVVASGVTLTEAEVEKVQGIADELTEGHTPVSFIYGGDTSSLLLTALPDLRTLSTTCPNVSTVILQDGDNYGASLAISKYSIPAIGATLGAVSLANVNESIAWVNKFNMAGSGELDTPAFGDGSLFKNTLDATLTQLNNYGYIFGIKHVGLTGTYLNDNHTNDIITSDYAYMSEVRVANKAAREIRTVMLPYLNSPVSIDPKTGYVSRLTILTWTNTINNVLTKMSSNAEISGYSVYINPAQNVLLTSTINVEVKIVPYGTAREFDITLGFAVSL